MSASTSVAGPANDYAAVYALSNQGDRRYSHSIYGSACYLLSNENYGNTYEILKRRPLMQNGAILGVGGTFNYDLICLRKPKVAIIFDFNPANITMHQDIQYCIESSGNRFECFEKIKQLSQYFFNPERLFYSSSAKDYTKKSDFEREISRQYSWLSSDENFRTIQEYVQNRLILCINLDICQTDKIIQLKQELKKRAFVVDCLFISNVKDWIFEAIKELKESMAASISELKDPETSIISSKKDSQKQGTLIQEVEGP